MEGWEETYNELLQSFLHKCEEFDRKKAELIALHKEVVQAREMALKLLDVVVFTSERKFKGES